MSLLDCHGVIPDLAQFLSLDAQDSDPPSYIAFLTDELDRHRAFLAEMLGYAIIFFAAVLALLGGLATFVGLRSWKDFKESARELFDKKISSLTLEKSEEFDIKFKTFLDQYQNEVNKKIEALNDETNNKVKDFQKWLLDVQEKTDNLMRNSEMIVKTKANSMPTETSVELNDLSPAVSERSKREMPSILWVDDFPENNSEFVSYFSKMGINITEVLTTDEALMELSKNTYDILISDLRRKEGSDAGIVLLRKIYSKELPRHRIIFASSHAVAEYGAKATELRAELVTSNPGRLVAAVNGIVSAGA